jgi:tyrosyl-tRNA synthetase
LIRKRAGHTKCCGATVKLLTNSKGEKLGKSMGNGLWCNPEQTSPYDFYQFFWKTADDEVEQLLKSLTFVSSEEIQSIMTEHLKHKEKRIAQKFLAETVTQMVHGGSVIEAITKSEVYFSPQIEKINEWSQD